MWWPRRRTYRKVTLENVRQLVNKGRWLKAHRIVRNQGFILEHESTAHFWFICMLIELLTNHENAARIALKRAKQCNDYTEVIEGDILRDQALFAIRHDRLAIAEQFIEDARRFHEDHNRLAVLKMTEARLAQARDELQRALQLYEEANNLWVELGNIGEAYDIQWACNNRFHWFRCSALAGEPIEDRAKIILLTDESHIRRWRVRLMRTFGLFGARIDNWLF